MSGPNEIERGDIWWADLPEPSGSGSGYRRPVLVIQADLFNRSAIGTVIVAVVTANLRLASAPGNVFLPARATGLARDSFANVSQLFTLDRRNLGEHIGVLPGRLQTLLNSGLRLAFDL